MALKQQEHATAWFISMLSERKDTSKIYVFDGRAIDKITSQVGISWKLIGGYRYLGDKKHEDRYIYAGHSNVVRGEITLRGEIINFGPYARELTRKNKLYANGGSEIYR